MQSKFHPETTERMHILLKQIQHKQTIDATFCFMEEQNMK